MAKYDFFGKRGRPTKEETEVCKKILSKIESGEIEQADVDSFVNEIGKPESIEDLETLHSFVTGETTTGENFESSKSQTNQPRETQESEYQENMSSSEGDIKGSENFEKMSESKKGIGGEALDFDPFGEPVIERDYTKGFQPVNEETHEENQTHGGEKDSNLDDSDFERPDLDSESVADQVGASSESSDGSLGGDIPDQNFEESVPEPDYIHSNVDDADYEEIEDGEEEDGEKEKLGGDNLEDMSPAQKRRAAEKTAEAIMEMYCKFSPLPFKSWSSISDKKVQKMVFNNELDTSMQIENGVTVKDYIDQVNEQVDDVFTVDDDTRESIKDPLIDVLLEQEVALTPTQRLMLAVGTHVVTMSFSAFQLSQNNKQALETFKQFHREMRGTTNNQTRKSKPNPSPTYSDDDFNDVDNESVEKMMKDFGASNGSDNVIDPNEDENVTVEETTED